MAKDVDLLIRPGTEGICRAKAGNHGVNRTEAQSGLESVFAAIDPGITVSQACKTQSAKIAGGREGRECQPFGNTPTHVGNGNVGACLEARLKWKRRDMIGERRSEEHTSELQSLMRI